MKMMFHIRYIGRKEVNVYMPYQHNDNYGTFMECIGKLSATIVDSEMCNFIILGDLF